MKDWTADPAADQKIRDKAGKVKPEVLAEQLGVTLFALRARAKKLNVKLRMDPIWSPWRKKTFAEKAGKMSKEDLAELLDLKVTQVQEYASKQSISIRYTPPVPFYNQEALSRRIGIPPSTINFATKKGQLKSYRTAQSRTSPHRYLLADVRQWVYDTSKELKCLACDKMVRADLWCDGHRPPEHLPFDEGLDRLEARNGEEVLKNLRYIRDRLNIGHKEMSIGAGYTSQHLQRLMSKGNNDYFLTQLQALAGSVGYDVKIIFEKRSPE